MQTFPNADRLQSSDSFSQHCVFCSVQYRSDKDHFVYRPSVNTQIVIEFNNMISVGVCDVHCTMYSVYCIHYIGMYYSIPHNYTSASSTIHFNFLITHHVNKHGFIPSVLCVLCLLSSNFFQSHAYIHCKVYNNNIHFHINFHIIMNNIYFAYFYDVQRPSAYALYTTQYTVHTTQYTSLDNILMIVCFVDTLYIVQCTLHKMRVKAHSTQCTVHNAQCTVHSTQCTVHNAQYTMHSTQCTVHNAQCTVHSTQCTVHNAQYTMHSTQCTVHNAQYTMHSTQCTVHNAQYTIHSTQCTVHNAQYTMHSTQCTVHNAQCTVHNIIQTEVCDTILHCTVIGEHYILYSVQ